MIIEEEKVYFKKIEEKIRKSRGLLKKLE